MGWREQEPDVPETDLEPFTVALKDSACDASAKAARLREQCSEYITYDSERAARSDLLDPDRPSLRFQSPAPNDPADVDAYLVKVREVDPAPDDRGPAREGWEFNMTAQQVGALSEALFDAYRYDPPPIVAYVAKDLNMDPDAFRVVVNPDDSPSIPSSDGMGHWRWDAHFTVHRRTEESPSWQQGPLLKQYLAEVKHGSTSFERNQRAEMERIAQDVPDVDVLVIRINLDGTPQTYSLTIARV